MLEALAGLFLFVLFIGLPALTLFWVLYYCNHGKSPFKLQAWQLFGVPFRALIPSLLTKILGKVRQAAAHGEMKLHEKTVEGTIKETRAWHGDLSAMQEQLAGLGLSEGTLDEFKGKVDTVKANGDNLQQALDLHRETQQRVAAEQQSVQELEGLLANMRALGMSPTAVQEVEARLLAANIKASQASVASHTIAGYLGTHATLPGGMVKSLPALLNATPTTALPAQTAPPQIVEKVPVVDNQGAPTNEPAAAPVTLAKGDGKPDGAKKPAARRRTSTKKTT